jgi:hypothetical protein
LVRGERYIEKSVGTSLELIGEDDPEDETITPEDIEMQGKVVYVIQTVNG